MSITKIVKQQKVPGILGGMGPEATVDFMAKVISQTPAKSDQEHIRLLVDHNPSVPNRHAAIAEGGREVASSLVDMARGLEKGGADFLMMVCNTAHAFQEDIRKAIDIPFISLIDEVISELENRHPQVNRVGVMAAEGCLAAELYQQALAQSGREFVTWSPSELNQFMSLLYQIKAGTPLADIKPPMTLLVTSLLDRGAEVLIAGCTEIPLVLSDADIPIPLLASTDILVASTIEYALGHSTLPR